MHQYRYAVYRYRYRYAHCSNVYIWMWHALSVGSLLTFNDAAIVSLFAELHMHLSPRFRMRRCSASL